MSLYGDLPKAKDETEEKRNASWAKNQLKGSFLPPAAVHRAGQVPGRGPGRGAGRGLQGGGRGISNAASVHGASNSTQEGNHAPTTLSTLTAMDRSTIDAGPSLFSTVPDEYDPLLPNDYMEIMRERELALKRAVEEADRAIKLREVQRAIQAAERKRKEEEDRRNGTATASTVPIDKDGPPSLQNVLRGNTGGLTAAQKMMEKMGWKAGIGLGRNNQGITAPLIATRVDGRTAVVTTGDPEDHIGLGGRGGPLYSVEDDRERGPNSIAERRREKDILEQSSTVLLLTNMVAPGEVDDHLEDETAGECARFGPVARVTIFEVTAPGYPEDEAVRIFVEFRDKASCIAAFRDLDGRWFGGRQVRARFFSQERFGKEDLAPGPDEGDPRQAAAGVEGAEMQ